MISSHYETLGLSPDCTAAEVREAYRRLVKQHHPDLNEQSAAAVERSQELNAAHEILSDPKLRRAYDREQSGRGSAPPRGRIERNITQEVRLRLEDFLHGTSLQVMVRDPVNPGDAEVYPLEVPAMTAPGARVRLPRPFTGGHVILRLRALPSARFKVRGSDLRCDLRIDNRRAMQGGPESVSSLDGRRVSVHVPARVARGEVLRVPGEGLPKPRGGRGDLLVRITYRPEVQVRRTR